MTEERRIVALATAAAPGTRVGAVAALLDEAVLVACGGDEIVACDLLEPRAAGTRPLAEGDPVLVVVPEGNGGRGVVLGRLLRPAPHGAAADGPPEEIVLEAKKELTLRVGEGSITLREDGKVVLRGRDLVSHARRLNRIRGGTVALN